MTEKKGNGKIQTPVGSPEDKVKPIDPNDPDPTRAAEGMGLAVDRLKKAVAAMPPPPGVSSHPLNSD